MSTQAEAVRAVEGVFVEILRAVEHSGPLPIERIHRVRRLADVGWRIVEKLRGQFVDAGEEPDGPVITEPRKPTIPPYIQRQLDARSGQTHRVRSMRAGKAVASC